MLAERLKAWWKRLSRPLPRRRARAAGVALLTVTISIAVIGAAVTDMAYNAQVDLEAAANSRDMLRAEYLARSSIQLGQLLVAVQSSINRMAASNPMLEPFLSMFQITDYAGFLAQAIGGDKDSRAGLTDFLGVGLDDLKGLGTPAGTGLDLNISSEEGRIFVNCAGGNADQLKKSSLYRLFSAMVRPARYDRLFGGVDVDNVAVTREDLPRNLIDWIDLDPFRFDLQGGSGGEDRYDRSSDRYEAHNHNLDTLEELHLVRGFTEDVWTAFGEMFTVYGRGDCRILASAVGADAWPMIAAMIAASSPDPSVVLDPNTTLVAQQVAGLLKTGLPLIKQLMKTLPKPPECDVSRYQSQCDQLAKAAAALPQVPGGRAPAPPPGAPPNPNAGPAGDSVNLLSDIICSPVITQMPALAQSMGPLAGSSAPPLTTPLRPIPMCKGQLSQYLAEKLQGTVPRRYYRIDASGSVLRNRTKEIKVRIRAVWDSEGNNFNPLCNNHPRCSRGVWKYWRMD